MERREIPPTSLGEVDTPALCVDLDRVDENVVAMQRYCDDHGLACRPHVKTHKLPRLALDQVDAGAVGIACQKLGEAEVMADAGLEDILLTFPLAGRAKAGRLAALAERVRMSVTVDSLVSAEALSSALAGRGSSADVLVDCDTGFGRTGVQSPEAAAELAQAVAGLPGLGFAGLFTYPSPPACGPWLRSARESIERAGLAVERASGGGTPTALLTHETGEVTELRVGTYVYGDRACVANGSVSLERCALVVRATVVSRPTDGRAIVDAGSKALTSDPASGADGFGHVVEYPDAIVYRLDEEHGYLDVTSCLSRPEIGEVVSILPNHACGATNLHDEVVVHRGGEVADVWAVAARGKLR